MSDLQSLIRIFKANEKRLNAADPESNDAELKVLMADVVAICAHRPADTQEANIKARFLLEWSNGVDGLTADESRALLCSMMDAEKSEDPLIAAIEAYRTGNAYFNAIPSQVTEKMEEQIVAATYGPPLAVLTNWQEPATSIEGVEAALRIAVEDGFGSDVQEAMVTAALGFFDAKEAANV